ncbi:hypothetical protein [Muricoccus aerilatus]|uniref:hypothetical protein n=1 Tax=Muricoccus aerilatus TaxID=452982 RepID=UPI0012EB8A4B|nr:hypothetical protein [Roseomonas aerilata]
MYIQDTPIWQAYSPTSSRRECKRIHNILWGKLDVPTIDHPDSNLKSSCDAFKRSALKAKGTFLPAAVSHAKVARRRP